MSLTTTTTSLVALATLGLASLLAPAARADSAPPAAPAPVQSFTAKATVRVGTQTRVHELAIASEGCRRITDKTEAYSDEIQICTRPAAQGVFLDVVWHTRNGAAEYETSSAIVLRRGGHFEVGRAGAARFTLQLG